MRKEVRSLYDPAREYFRKIASDYKGSSLERILFRGIITFVDREGKDNRPRFSIKAKIFGIDDQNESNIENDNFYPSLLSIHQLAIPEVGEEVLIICEEIGNLSTGYWISRSDIKNSLTKVLAGDDLNTFDEESQTTSDKYGTSKLPKEEVDISPDEKYNIPDPRVKPGDVISQGRSNSFSRHSFDSTNKAGTIEHVTEEQPISNEEFYTKDYRKSNGSRVLLTTKSDIDTLVRDIYNKEVHSNFTQKSNNRSITPKKEYDSAYLLLETIELRLISRNSENKIQHAVLAEEQSIWLKQLIDLVRDLIDDIQIYRENVVTLTNNVATHVHMATGPTSPPLIPESIQFNSQLPNKFSIDQEHFNTDKQDFETIKDGGNTQVGENKGIRFHHSDHVGLN